MKKNLTLEYEEYRKEGGTEPFGWWCAFIRPLPEEETRAALLTIKDRNKEFIDSQKDTVWTPNGRVKMNPEYIQNAIRLREFQKAQREADPGWMAYDALTKRLTTASDQGQLKQEIKSIKKELDNIEYFNPKKTFCQKIADWILDKLPRLE